MNLFGLLPVKVVYFIYGIGEIQRHKGKDEKGNAKRQPCHNGDHVTNELSMMAETSSIHYFKYGTHPSIAWKAPPKQKKNKKLNIPIAVNVFETTNELI